MIKKGNLIQYIIIVTMVVTVPFFALSANQRNNSNSFLQNVYCNTLGKWFNDSYCKNLNTTENTVANSSIEFEANNQTITYKSRPDSPLVTKTNPVTSLKNVINTNNFLNSKPSTNPPTISNTNNQTLLSSLKLPTSLSSDQSLSLKNFVTHDFLSRQVGSLGDSFGRSLSNLSTQLTALIPSTASISNWDSFFTTPSTRITAGTGLSWNGNTLSATGGGVGDFTLASWYATTTNGLAEGLNNLYYTDSRVNTYLNASTTLPKSYSNNTFTGNNTFNGNLTLSTLNGPLQSNNGLVSATTSIGVLYGGTGATTFGQGWLYSSGGTSALQSSTSPTVAYITATSTTATSTFMGNIRIEGNLSGNVYATSTDFNFYNITMWGDSLTLGLAPVFSSIEPNYSINNGGYGGQNSTSIASRMIATPSSWSKPTIIWVGNNDATTTMPATVENNIANMVARLNPVTPYLVLGLDINAAYPLGDISHTVILNTNTALAALYPNNFLDIRSYLVNYACNPNPVWYASTTQDVIDCSNDLVPASIRVDSIHMNRYGYLMIANRLDSWLRSIYPNTKKPLSYSDLQSILINPPSFNNININPGSGAYPNSDFPSGYILYNGTPFAFASTTLYNYFLAGAGYNYGQVLNGTYTSTTGTNNIGVGFNNLNALTTGIQNTAVGNVTLTNNTTGSSNSAFGANALRLNTTGSGNTAVGLQALYNNISSDSNSAFGKYSLTNNTAGSNSAFGANSLFSNTTGSNNTVIGQAALYYNTTGTYNIGIGNRAGYDTTASPFANSQSTVDNYMILIGEEASRDTNILNSLSLNNAIAIGYKAKVGCSNCLVFGGLGSNTVKVGIGTTSPYASLSIFGSNVATTTFALTGYYNQTAPLILVASTTGSATSTAFIIDSNGKVGIATTSPAGTFGINGTMFIGGSGTSTIQSNLNVLGTLHALTSYTGDLFFANNFSFTESQPIDASSTQGLYLKNQNGNKVMDIDDNGNLSLSGDLCANGKECFGKSLNTLTNTLNTLASSTILDSLSIQSTNQSLGDLQLEVLNIKSTLTTLNTTLNILSSSSTLISSIASSTLEYISSSTAFTNLASSTINTITTNPSFVQSIAQSVLNLIQSTSNWVVGQITGTLAKFTRLESDSVQTNSLCVDDICLSKDQLKALLINAGGVSTSSVPVQPSNVISPENNQESKVIEQLSSTSTPETISLTSASTSNDLNKITPSVELNVSTSSTPTMIEGVSSSNTESIVNTVLNQNNEQLSTPNTAKLLISTTTISR